MKNQTTLKQRIESICNHYGISEREFCITCELYTGYSNNTKRVTRKAADLITAKFPEINRHWLLTGQGTMLGAPLVKTFKHPAIVQDIPGIISTSDTFITIRDNANAPSWQIGDIVCLKLLEKDAVIISGRIYAVHVLHSRTIVRKLIDHEDGTFTLIATNEEEFPDITISREQIEDIFDVVGLIRIEDGNV